MRTSVTLPGTLGALAAAVNSDEWIAMTSEAVGTACWFGRGTTPGKIAWAHPALLHFVRCAAGVQPTPESVPVAEPAPLTELPTSPSRPGPEPQPPTPHIMPKTDHLVPILTRTWEHLGRPNLGSGSTRETRNAFFLAYCAVMHYGHPTLNPSHADGHWGAKRADVGRPQSDDVICYRTDEGRLLGWDLMTGVGADGWSFGRADGPGEDLTGQVWIEPPREALPAGGSSGAPPLAPSSVPFDAGAVQDLVARVDTRFSHLRRGTGEQQREWMARVAFALARRLSDRFGRKRAGPDRPISRNVLAYRLDSETFLGVSLVNESTAALEFVVIGPLSMPQQWLTAPSFDDMGDLLTTPSPPRPAAPSTTPSPDEVEALVARAVQPLQEQVDDLRARVRALSLAAADLEDAATELNGLADRTANRLASVRAEIVGLVGNRAG